MSLPLFPDEIDEATPARAQRLGPRLRELADEGIFLGTSSWKYPGWLGSIYDPDRYSTRGKFSKSKFDDACLREYAETFPIVGADFTFYQFPTEEIWSRLCEQTPRSFRFAMKVTEDITVPIWPTLPKYGARAGRTNEFFLDPKQFSRLFVQPLLPHRHRVAVLIFEFGTLPYPFTAESFDRQLDAFLGALPGGLRYAVEIRNSEFLTADHLRVLKAHNVAHVFNAWTRMPALGDQIAVPGALDTADFVVSRALSRTGRTFEQASAQFQPFDRVQEPDPRSRRAIRALMDHAREGNKPAFLFVGNRLEGCSPETIEAIVSDAE